MVEQSGVVDATDQDGVGWLLFGSTDAAWRPDHEITEHGADGMGRIGGDGAADEVVADWRGASGPGIDAGCIVCVGGVDAEILDPLAAPVEEPGEGSTG